MVVKAPAYSVGMAPNDEQYQQAMRELEEGI